MLARWVAGVALALVLGNGASWGQPPPDVAVIVDTSRSMAHKGMDPERASLLVTKLLADLVPGDFSAIRLLDIHDDLASLPRTDTGVRTPCADDPTSECNVISPSGDWGTIVRQQRLGALVRPARGDAGFKSALDSHLAQTCSNSLFGLALRSAQGVFEHNGSNRGSTNAERTIIWLSDGRAEDESLTLSALADLRKDGVDIAPLVFGRGDLNIAKKAGLTPHRVSSSAEIMAAFAQMFRKVMRAPYEIDHLVSQHPEFEIKPFVDEAWVVVYGDDSLSSASVSGPAGTIDATYAQDSWRRAGAYRVAHMTSPRAGPWRVAASGGGSGLAYAVVQRSNLGPIVLSPDRVPAGGQYHLVVGVRAGTSDTVLSDPAVLGQVRLEASVAGALVNLHDDGRDGDERGGDGRFTAKIDTPDAGDVAIAVHLTGEIVDQRIDHTLHVEGVFRYKGDPVAVDLGSLRAGETSCRPVVLVAEHRGQVSFELRASQALPSQHELFLHAGSATMRPGSPALIIPPGSNLELCLETGRGAPSSQAAREPWLVLAVAGSTLPDQSVPILLSWHVEPLTFWERWGRIILGLLLALLLAALVYGYIYPLRFSPSLSATFVPDVHDIDDYTPQPVVQWRGVGIGFYRHARAYLHGDCSISGAARGAVSVIRQERGGPRVEACTGSALFYESVDGKWEPVATSGVRARTGTIYRIGTSGPYFRLSMTGRGR